LDVGDPPFADVYGLEDERLAPRSVVSDPVGANYEAVITGRDELGCARSLIAGPRGDPTAHLLEDRTGLVGAASTRRVAPPEDASLDTAPLGVRAEETDELREVSLVRQLVRTTHPLKRLRWHDSSL